MPDEIPRFITKKRIDVHDQSGSAIEAIDRIDLSEQTKFRLDEISKIKNYFHEEINQRKPCCKNYLNMLLLLITQTKF